MEIKLRTLTPLWTGGVDGKVDRIHETGILGSLRWWYEAIVRGLGGSACDPSKGKCLFDPEKYGKSKATEERGRLRAAGLCDVCQVFGATGWQRRFRLEVGASSVSNAHIKYPIKTARSYIKKVRDKNTNEEKEVERTPTWYFPDPTKTHQKPTPPNTPKSGSFIIYFHQLFPDFNPEIIGGLIQFVADWAALGAKPQMGFGVVETVNGRLDTRHFYNWITAVSGGNQDHDLPSLRDIFFARILNKNGQSFSEEDTFNLKYDLRRLFRSDAKLRHFVMGTVKGERKAAKVKMSRPYDHEGKSTIRVWGWIPEEAGVYRNGWNREKVLEQIHDHLETNYELEVWREMNSAGDTRTPNNDNVKSFLRSLLGLEE